MPETLIFELSKKGRKGYTLSPLEVPEQKIEELIPSNLLRKKKANLPEVGESEIMRHFVRMSEMNYHIDKGFYPLGSCTMKYNPKINEETAGMPGFTKSHPEQPVDSIQGCLEILHELEQTLMEVTGLQAVTTQPVAGSQGELTGIMLMKKYHEQKNSKKKTILIPDSAHGTNPSSVVIGGYSVVEVKSNDKGQIDFDDFMLKLDDEVAGMMITNPNTLGIFEKDFKRIADALHEKDGIMYMDGANLNALLGILKPGDIGVDILHINLHKTFSTPHGGGGPGAGPLAISEKLIDFLPVPRIAKIGDKFDLDYNHPLSVGRVHSFYGNFGILVRALTYMTMHGKRGMRRISENAILNANYLLHKLKDNFEHPFGSKVMHEFVLSGSKQKDRGAKATYLAKRLLDFGFHAPTIYFPLIVKEAIMIEPTETETKETLDAFAEALIKIDGEIDTDIDKLISAPLTTPVRRLDEAKASKDLNVKYNFDE